MKKEKHPSLEPLLLTVEEAALVIGFSRSVTYELIRTGYLKTVRVGSGVRVHRDECIKFAKRAATEIIPLPKRERKKRAIS